MARIGFRFFVYHTLTKSLILAENEDYVRFDKIIETTGGRSIEYALSIDAGL